MPTPNRIDIYGVTGQVDDAATITTHANPANGKRKTVDFYYDGTSWIQRGAASGDI